MRRPIRVAAVVAIGALGWAAGASYVAAPVYASQCPNGSTCSPDTFTDPPGTLLASISGTLTASGSFTANYTEAVFSTNNAFCSGCLDFFLQVQNQQGSAMAIQHVNVSNFQGTQADIGYRTDGSALPGGLFVNGSQIPTDVSRSLTGAVITWDFTGTNAVNLLPPGTTTFVLVVETDATSFTAGTVSAQDGGATQAAGFQPVAPPPPANVPDSPWVPVMGLFGGALVAGVAVRRRGKETPTSLR